MNTITIPSISRKSNQLVAVPKSIYKDFLLWQKKTKSKNTFAATPAEKKAIARGRKEIAERKCVSMADL